MNKPLVSGLIHFAISQRAGGALKALRVAARLLVQARLRIYKGAAPPGPGTPAWEYREACRGLFLGPDDGRRGASRRLILRRMMNGNSQLQSQLEHYCPAGCFETQTLHRFCNEVVDSLLPSACPCFPRSRWTNANVAVNCGGLLAACHGILMRIVPPMGSVFGQCCETLVQCRL